MDKFILVRVRFGLFKSSVSESVSSACCLGGANLSLHSLLLSEILSGLGCGDEDSDILLSGGSEAIQLNLDVIQAVVSTSVVVVSLSPSLLFFSL